nr:2'-5' RNA ligase family protein [Streptomyces sp. SID5785]
MLPEADELLRLAASVDERVVRAGVPAHVAFLYPWLPSAQVDDAELERLRAALPAGRVTVTLSAVQQADGFVGVPVPALASRATAVRGAYPRQVPYGGRFGPDPQVHVTVALGAEPQAAEDIARRVAPRLPITAQVAALHVVELTDAGWRLLAELPLEQAGPC